MTTLPELLGNRPDFWLSMVVIIFMLGMGVFFVAFFIRNIRQEAAQGKDKQDSGKTSTATSSH